MPALVAWLHHIAAFTLVASLVVESVLIREPLTLGSARRLQLADLCFGSAALAIVMLGLVRVFYLEKGADYYFHSVPFIGKLFLFVLVGLLSVYPTVAFLSWRKPLKQRQIPIVKDQTLRAIRVITHLELLGVVLLILCAALTAKGIRLGP
jgi:putative membrane protein